MSHIAELRKMLTLLEESFETVKTRLKEDMPDVNPMTVSTSDGRFILLDTLTEIVRTKTVLFQLDQAEPYVLPSNNTLNRTDTLKE